MVVKFVALFDISKYISAIRLFTFFYQSSNPNEEEVYTYACIPCCFAFSERILKCCIFL
jgi:hypothetical protein